ncbi:hypothetical protein CL616_04525 [archaeon]|nr:hypothetical protein [archaeon]
MRLKKEYIVITFLLGILFITGCAGEQATTTEGYYGCYSGETSMIDAAFYDWAPLSSQDSPYQPGEDIDVEIVLENKLPEEIKEGKVKVRLRGDAINDKIFSGSQLISAPTLYDIDDETCTTSEEDVELGPIVYLPDLNTEIVKEIAAQYCYEHPVEVHGFVYYTELTEDIGVNLPSGSNPPSGVQVTTLEQDPVDVSDDEASLRIKIYVQNVGTGTIVEDLDECFEHREQGYRETLHLEVDSAYEDDCDQDIRLSKDDLKQEIVSCEITGINPDNLGPQSSDLKITLSGFAYEDEMDSVDIWIEP